MLDLDDPRSSIIFKASSYSDKVKLLCRKYILQNFEERQDTFDEMEFYCLELISFSEIHFPDVINNIKKLTSEIITEIDKLRLMNPVAVSGFCSVCGTPIKKPQSYSKLQSQPEPSHCEKCPHEIMMKLHYLEFETGAYAI